MEREREQGVPRAVPELSPAPCCPRPQVLRELVDDAVFLDEESYARAVEVSKYQNKILVRDLTLAAYATSFPRKSTGSGPMQLKASWPCRHRLSAAFSSVVAARLKDHVT